MTSETRSNLILGTVVFVVGVTATVGALIYTGGAQTQATTNLDDILNAADAASMPAEGTMQLAQGPAPQGAPIDSGPSAPTPSERDPIKEGLISKESLNLLGAIDPGGEGADLFKFDKTKDGLYYKVSFKALGGFNYEVPDPEVVRSQPDPTKPPTDQVPEALRKIDDGPVLLAGFMVPIDLDAEGKVRSFALTQDMMFCCYGVPPKMNEWVMVEMQDGHTAEYKNNVPIAVYGTLEIGEEIEDGYVLSLYRLTSDKVVDVKNLLDAAKG